MAELKSEYTDIRNIRHKVEHLLASAEDKKSREQTIQELFRVLTKSDKCIPA